MKSYLKYVNAFRIYILGFLIMNVCTSCQVFKANSNMITVTEASYCKTFGGQGRSRSINFDVKTEESLALVDAIYWLEIDGFKIDLKLHQDKEKSQLIGFYTENRPSREANFESHSLFDKIPFTDIVLKIKKPKEISDVLINKLKNKPTKYYP